MYICIKCVTWNHIKFDDDHLKSKGPGNKPGRDR